MLDEALSLIKQQENLLSDADQKERLFIDLLLKGDISLDKYIEFRNLVEPVEVKKTFNESRTVNPVRHEKTTIVHNNGLKFCINCGTKLYSGNKFCTHCGAKL